MLVIKIFVEVFFKKIMWKQIMYYKYTFLKYWKIYCFSRKRGIFLVLKYEVVAETQGRRFNSSLRNIVFIFLLMDPNSLCIFNQVEILHIKSNPLGMYSLTFCLACCRKYPLQTLLRFFTVELLDCLGHFTMRSSPVLSYFQSTIFTLTALGSYIYSACNSVGYFVCVEYIFFNWK